MNFLAHIYLSKEQDQLKIGNFIADWVKGKTYLNYPTQIQNGIILHREIDTFTDAHPLWRESKKLFVPNHNHYSSVIIDILYDHFLAINWDKYCAIDLEQYAQNFYTLLEQNAQYTPEKARNFLPIMKSENWLVKYKSVEGLGYILGQMDRRTKGKSTMQNSLVELQQHKGELQHNFTLFFAELTKHVSTFTKENSF